MRDQIENLQRRLLESERVIEAQKQELERRALILDAAQNLGWKWAASQDVQERKKGEELRDTIDYNS